MSKEMKQGALTARTFNEEEVITIETSEDLISIAQRRLDTVKKIINLALKITTHRDWVNQNGNPYLVHSGAEKVARLFGISLSNIKTEKMWAEDTKGKYYIYKTTGKATLPGKFDSIEALGTCSQRDPFFGKAGGKFLETLEIDETNIMKASYSNFAVNSITHLLGLRNLTWDELKEAGIDKGKIQEIKYQSGSKKVQKTATADEAKKQKEIWDWLMQITAGNDELARERLKLETGFKPKDGSDYVEGKKRPQVSHWKMVEYYPQEDKGDIREAVFWGRGKGMIDIVERLDKEAAKRIKQFPHPNNRASEAGHPCLRFLVLSRLYPEKKALHDIGLQRIFDEGNLHERAVLREIEEAGFELVEQQRGFEWKKFQLTGRIDAKIKLNGNLIPLEIKSCSPNIFPSIKDSTVEEMIHSKYVWIKRYPGQILSYMMMDNKEEGIIIFKNKTTGEKCQKNFKLDYGYMEIILQKLEKVNKHVAKNEMPEVEVSEECNSCGFSKTVCFPDKDYGPGFIILSDNEREEMLNRREELKNYTKEYNSLDNKLKAHFKGQNVVCGDFKIESKEIERKGYMVESGSYIKVMIEKL